MAFRSNIDVVIRAHPGFSLAEMARRYEQTANECDNKAAWNWELPDAAKADWRERAAEARWIASELRKRAGG